jgi:hypothetical protein
MIDEVLFYEAGEAEVRVGDDMYRVGRTSSSFPPPSRTGLEISAGRSSACTPSSRATGSTSSTSSGIRAEHGRRSSASHGCLDTRTGSVEPL